MKKKNNYSKLEKDIDYIIFKNFIFVLKKHKMYLIFRCLVGTNTHNSFNSIYANIPSFSKIYARQIRDNLFNGAEDLGSFVNRMKTFGIVKKDNTPEEIQRHVADSVNNLLHLFIESQVRNFDTLERLGEEMFNLSCREIFGGDFEDKLPKPQNVDMEKIKQINEMIHSNGIRITPELIREINRIMENGGNLGGLIQAPGFEEEYNPYEEDDNFDDFL